MDISINQSNIKDSVYVITGHSGRANGDMDKISLTEDEQNIIDKYIDMAVNDIAGIAWMKASVSGSTISFDLPSNWDDSYKETLSNAVNAYITNAVLYRWASIAEKDKVPFYKSELESAGMIIKNVLNKRVKPSR